MKTLYWASHALCAAIGIAAGLGFVQTLLHWLPDWMPFPNQAHMARVAIGAVLLFTGALFTLRVCAQLMVIWSGLPSTVKARYRVYDAFAYLPFLVFNLTASGVPIPLSSTPVFVLGACVLLQAVLICGLLTTELGMGAFASFQWLSFLFFLSGFAALIYQIVWQRVLFGLFGVNIESVTITVSLFMFGLGVGSLVGGQLARRLPAYAPQLFLLCEAAIGIFGLFSIPLIERVGEATLQGSPFTVSLATYALLGLPTMAMGATLPILVSHLNRFYANVGKSVGILYFSNTLGSAAACFVTADILFVLLGLQAAVYVAAAGNFIVAILVFAYCRQVGRKKGRMGEWENGRNTEQDSSPVLPSSPSPILSSFPPLRFLVALLLAGATGYISLSQEILWFRAISYITAGKPDVFAYVLGFLLVGVALGALIAKQVCEAGSQYAMPFIVIVLALSGLCYDLSLPLSAACLTHYGTSGLVSAYFAVTIIAMMLGSVFPVVCHFGVQGRTAAGFWLSLVYFVNIVGATAGPLLTGFVLLQVLPLDRNCLYLSVATLALSGVLGFLFLRNNRPRIVAVTAATAAIAFLAIIHEDLYNDIFAKMHLKSGYAAYLDYHGGESPYKYLIQNRSGVIAVEDMPPADVIYGGGIYDGRFNIDPLLRSPGEFWSVNIIERAYMMAALHSEPRDVLEIGLSSGSWSRVLADNRAIEHLTIVEINPGYVELMDHYPESAEVKRDPRVNIVVDDGRRWLRRHPDHRFDFILMNTSYHWRDHCTNLLSAEFLQLCKDHLKPGGVMYYNTTESTDVIYTAAQVFAHITIYYNFVAGSDSPFDMTDAKKQENLLRFVHDGQQVFDLHDFARRRLLRTHFIDIDMTDQADYWRARKGHWRITDDNMATEYKSIDNGEDRWEISLAGRLLGRQSP